MNEEPPDRPRILFVEDEALVRSVIALELEEAGLDVIEAPDGPTALALLASKPIDILFTDIRLPGSIDGWTIAEAARRKLPDLPVIYATGYAPDEPRKVESSRLLTKPYRPSALLQTIAEFGIRLAR
jgi:CheY-like chemotaxis protein